MGWNSWNWWGKRQVNERLVRETIDAIVDSGLKDAGYEYVVVDGGWRDNHLADTGELLQHPQRFPSGMKALADYAHSKGLKFGLHTVPGTLDCGGDKVGAWGIEEVHIRQFVDWGIDFIKLDRCKFVLPEGLDGSLPTGQAQGWTAQRIETAYRNWHDLLGRCGRRILLSASAYRYYDWYPAVAQMGRTTGDIRSRQSGGAVFEGGKHSVMAIAELNNAAARHAGQGYWNDPDMLVTGEQGLNQEEQKTHFALWCVISAPLMLGNDPRVMTEAEKSIVLNRECIIIDQDPSEQGRRIRKDGHAEVWAKKLTGARMAVLLLNRNPTETNAVSADWKLLGLSGKMSVKDVYGKTDLGLIDKGVSLRCPPHGCRLLLLSPGTTPAASH